MKIIKILLPIIVVMLFLTSCSKETYLVSFDTVGGSIVSGQKVEEGKRVTKPTDPEKDGYDFVGWYKSSSYHENDLYDFNEAVSNSFTLYAKYEKIEYKISYDYNYNDTNIKTVNFDNCNQISLEVPSRMGYAFLGWYEGDNLITTIENRNYQLVARWEKTHYVVTYKIDETTTEKELLKIGDALNLKNNPTKDGYTFLGWYLNDELINSEITVNSDIEIVAKWDAKKFNVNFITYTDDVIESQIVNYGELLKEPTTPVKEGYTFLGWINILDLYDFNTPVTEDLQLLASWEITKDKIIDIIDNMIPEEITDNINAFTSLSFCSARFEWTSSDEAVITKDGKIRRLTIDTTIYISVEVIYEDDSFILNYQTIIPKVELKPLIKGEIVSGYLYDSTGFDELSEKTLSQIDIINFSFAGILNGEIILPNDEYVEKILKYRNSGVRIVLAIGGWGAGGFSEAMSSSSSRTKLVNSIMEVLDEYQFDGIDIDWEYPTSSVAGITSSPSDRNNLTLFSNELVERMKNYRSDLIYSIAIAPSNTFYDLTALNKCVDYFNLMTYDFSMGKKAGHDSALYSTSVTSSSMNNSVSIVKQYVDADKIIPGAAFYARYGSFGSSSNAVLGGTLSVAMDKALSFKVMYDKIIKNNLTELYDTSAEAAYIINGLTYYSYDNVRSVIAKCNYVKNKGLAGLMCWEITQDYVSSDGTSILLNAMYENLK